jgi:ribosomal protein L44E
MPNRRLTHAELQELFAPLVAEVRKRLIELSAGETDLHWALRRKLAKELTYDERGKPMERRALKAAKRAQQAGKCAECGRDLPAKNVVLDRLTAMGGYTTDNTRLLCRECDYRIQQDRGFA